MAIPFLWKENTINISLQRSTRITILFELTQSDQAILVEASHPDHPLDHAESSVAFLQGAAVLELVADVLHAGQSHLALLQERLQPLPVQTKKMIGIVSMPILHHVKSWSLDIRQGMISAWLIIPF